MHSAEAAEKLDNILFTTLTTLRPGDCYVSMILQRESYMQHICAAWYTLWPGVNSLFYFVSVFFRKNVNIAFILCTRYIENSVKKHFQKTAGK